MYLRLHGKTAMYEGRSAVPPGNAPTEIEWGVRAGATSLTEADASSAEHIAFPPGPSPH
jgi:hypothetical protein